MTFTTIRYSLKHETKRHDNTHNMIWRTLKRGEWIFPPFLRQAEFWKLTLSQLQCRCAYFPAYNKPVWFCYKKNLVIKSGNLARISLGSTKTKNNNNNYLQVTDMYVGRTHITLFDGERPSSYSLAVWLMVRYFLKENQQEYYLCLLYGGWSGETLTGTGTILATAGLCFQRTLSMPVRQISGPITFVLSCLFRCAFRYLRWLQE